MQPRRFWQGTVFLMALMLVGAGVLMAAGGVRISAVTLVVGAIDIVALLALAGYAWRRPLKHAGVEIMVLLLAAVQFLRLTLIAIVLWPNVFPWRGDSIAWQAVFTYCTLPLLLLVAVGLYRYATDRSATTLERPVSGTKPSSSLSVARLDTLAAAYGDPDHADLDTDRSKPIDIYAFARNFAEECDEETTDDEGYMLVTSGMSDFAMAIPPEAEDESPLIELIWYVRDLRPEYFQNLRWLARLPSLDRTWFGMGHTVPLPIPPLSFCRFSTFLLLPSTIRSDRQVFEELEQQGTSAATLVVHLLSPPEYELVKTTDGLNRFLDLLDEHDYPLIFDPTRKSFL